MILQPLTLLVSKTMTDVTLKTKLLCTILNDVNEDNMITLHSLKISAESTLREKDGRGMDTTPPHERQK